MDSPLISDSIYALIFSHFPLQELLPYRGVCSRWNGTILRLASQQVSLKLFASSKDASTYSTQLTQRYTSSSVDDLSYWSGSPVDDLVLRPSILTPEFASHLVSLFTHIRHLIVYFHPDRQFNNLPYLLQELPGLQSLSICGSVTPEYNPQLSFIFTIINTLPHLKRLDLLATNLFLNYPYCPRLPYSIMNCLAQLEHFSLNGQLNSRTYLPDSKCSLPHLPAIFEFLSEACHYLHLKDVKYPELSEIYDALSGNPRLVTSVTHISLSGEMSFPFVKFICRNFRYLTKLELDFKIDNISNPAQPLYPQMLQEMSYHTNLTSLSLANFVYNFPPFSGFLPSDTESPITSLHLINFSLNNQTAGNYRHFCRDLSQHYPNLEHLYVKNLYEEEAITQIAHCLSLFGNLVSYQLISEEAEINSANDDQSLGGQQPMICY